MIDMLWAAYYQRDSHYHRPLGWDGDRLALERLVFYEKHVRLLCRPSMHIVHNEGTKETLRGGGKRGKGGRKEEKRSGYTRQ